MSYYTAEEINKVKEIDLLSYLQAYEPQELVRISGNCYCIKEHDSLKISNGKWCWFSRGIGGKSALDFLIKVRGFSFTQAMDVLSGAARASPAVCKNTASSEAKVLLMPSRNSSSNEVYSYLKGRGIDEEIISYCIRKGLLFESKDYHNAVFLGFDRNGIARYGSVRGTKGNYKGELSGSDKHFSFSLPAGTDSVHIFESAIDLLSYATMVKKSGRNWLAESYLSLAGVFKTKRPEVIPVALQQYLSDHSQVRNLFLHLDNDEIGRGATDGIMAGLKEKYQIVDCPPKYGKDVNDELRFINRKTKELSR